MSSETRCDGQRLAITSCTINWSSSPNTHQPFAKTATLKPGGTSDVVASGCMDVRMVIDAW